MSKLYILPRALIRQGGQGQRRGCQDTRSLLSSLTSSTRRISASGAELEALEAQVLNLSLKYNFVTPLTHMVVTKPEGQEQFQVAEKPVEVGECGAGS